MTPRCWQGECGLRTPVLLEEWTGAGSEMPACRGRFIGTLQRTLALGESQACQGLWSKAEGTGREEAPRVRGFQDSRGQSCALQGLLCFSPAKKAQALKYHPSPNLPLIESSRRRRGQGCAAHCVGRRHVNSLSSFQPVAGLQGYGGRRALQNQTSGSLAHLLSDSELVMEPLCLSFSICEMEMT